MNIEENSHDLQSVNPSKTRFNSPIKRSILKQKNSILDSPLIKGRSYALEKQRELMEMENKKKRLELLNNAFKDKICYKYKLSIENYERSKKEKLKTMLANNKTLKNNNKSNYNTTNIISNIENKNTKINNKIKLHSLPKNVNEYKHLLKKSNLVDADIQWVLDLREKNKLEYKDLIKKIKEAPSFYNNYTIQFKNKIKKVSDKYLNCKLYESVDFKDSKNLNQTLHLFKSSPSVNKDIVDFETNLRDYKTKTNKSNMSKTQNSWLSIGYKTSPYFWNNKKIQIDSKFAKDLYNKHNNMLIRPCKYEITKMDIPIDYSKNIVTNLDNANKNSNQDASINIDYKFNTTNKFYKKRLTYDKNSLISFLGEHKSLPPFKSNNPIKDPLASTYNGINLGSVNHLLRNNNYSGSSNSKDVFNTNKNNICHSNVLWQLNLRNELENKANNCKKLYDKKELSKIKIKNKENRQKKKDDANKYYNLFFKK